MKKITLMFFAVFMISSVFANQWTDTITNKRIEVVTVTTMITDRNTKKHIDGGTYTIQPGASLRLNRNSFYFDTGNWLSESFDFSTMEGEEVSVKSEIHSFTPMKYKHGQVNSFYPAPPAGYTNIPDARAEGSCTSYSAYISASQKTNGESLSISCDKFKITDLDHNDHSREACGYFTMSLINNCH